MEIIGGNNKLFRFIDEEGETKNRIVELQFVGDNALIYTDNSLNGNFALEKQK